MHQTCRSCHVPPPQPEPVEVWTDCAVCHGAVSDPPSLYLALSVRALTVDLVFDDSVPEAARAAWREELVRRVEEAAVDVHPVGTPNAAPVRVRIAVDVDAGRTDTGVDFHAARGRAVVELHRARVEVVGAPWVAADAAAAVRGALDRLAEEVSLTLTW